MTDKEIIKAAKYCAGCVRQCDDCKLHEDHDCVNEFAKYIVNHNPTTITQEAAIDRLRELGWLQEHDKELTETNIRIGAESNKETTLSLIDANAVLNIVAAYCPDDDGSCSKAGVDLREMLDEIEALPEIDARPVKYGRWLSHFEYCKLYNYSPSGTSVHFWCSRCVSAAKEKTLYCPNCGAEMVGGADK